MSTSATPPTVLELARACGINRSTAWRLLRTSLNPRQTIGQIIAQPLRVFGTASGRELAGDGQLRSRRGGATGR